MTQAELGRQLAAALHRPYGRKTVCNLCAGGQSLKADEMLEISRICRVPVPRLGARAARSSRSVAAPAPNMFDADRGTVA